MVGDIYRSALYVVKSSFSMLPTLCYLPAMKSILVAVVLFASVVTALPQQGKLYRIGVLQPVDPERDQLRGLRAGLSQLGYVEGKNLNLNISNVKTYDELRPIAKSYVEKHLDLIVSIGGTPASIAKEATKEVPVVFLGVSADPVELGLVKSLARPETNLTGLTSTTGAEFEGKRLELFKDLVPNLRRVALLYNVRSAGHEKRLTLLREVAPKLALKLSEKPSKSVVDIDELFRDLSKKTADGIFIISSAGLFSGEICKKIVANAIQKKLPLWGCGNEPGFLATYSSDGYHEGVRAAWYADKIFKGTKPTDLPVERPTKFQFVINLKTASLIGITIPQWTLMKADRVIKEAPAKAGGR